MEDKSNNKKQSNSNNKLVVADDDNEDLDDLDCEISEELSSIGSLKDFIISDDENFCSDGSEEDHSESESNSDTDSVFNVTEDESEKCGPPKKRTKTTEHSEQTKIKNPVVTNAVVNSLTPTQMRAQKRREQVKKDETECIDLSNIVTGKRTRKAPERFIPEDYAELMLNADGEVDLDELEVLEELDESIDSERSSDETITSDCDYQSDNDCNEDE